MQHTPCPSHKAIIYDTYLEVDFYNPIKFFHSVPYLKHGECGLGVSMKSLDFCLQFMHVHSHTHSWICVWGPYCPWTD